MDWSGQMGGVGAVLGLLAATLCWLRRRGIAGILPARRAARRRMECLERLALGPQHTLHLVRLGDRTMLVAASPAGCALVESFSSRELDGAREAGRCDSFARRRSGGRLCRWRERRPNLSLFSAYRPEKTLRD